MYLGVGSALACKGCIIESLGMPPWKFCLQIRHPEIESEDTINVLVTALLGNLELEFLPKNTSHLHIIPPAVLPSLSLVSICCCFALHLAAPDWYSRFIVLSY